MEYKVIWHWFDDEYIRSKVMFSSSNIEEVIKEWQALVNLSSYGWYDIEGVVDDYAAEFMMHLED